MVEMARISRYDTFPGIGEGCGRCEPIYVSDVGYSKEHFVIPKHYEADIDRVLIPHGTIDDRIEKLAFDIKKHFAGAELHLLCVLKGSRWFFGRLLSYLNKIHIYTSGSPSLPYLEHYVRLKCYENDSCTGKLQVISEDLSCLKGKRVLIVEDIIDTGHTLTQFCLWLESLQPKTLAVASLLEKRTDLSNGFKGDFVGFSVPNSFVVGFSLDYNELFRDLEHICVLNKTGQARHRKTSLGPADEVE
eukprot:GHVQ01039672.1.p1 GENE.GHVQ01039672.1~~GHVQ01039672.1.p1  ORF type:complete len:246 (+),score=16.30 GHVQ01039672.1:135-872(+)